MLMIFVALALSANVFAAPKPSAGPLIKAIATLEYGIHDGGIKKMQVEWRKSGVYVDKKKLSGTGLLGGRGHLARVLDVRNLKAQPGCTAGHFVHTVKRGKTVKTETGCITDPRFESKGNSFLTLLRIAWRTGG